MFEKCGSIVRSFYIPVPPAIRAEARRFLESIVEEESRGMDKAPVVILVVVGVAVLAGVAFTGRGLWSRRRQK